MEGRGERAWALRFCSRALHGVHTLPPEFGSSDQPASCSYSHAFLQRCTVSPQTVSQNKLLLVGYFITATREVTNTHTKRHASGRLGGCNSQPKQENGRVKLGTPTQHRLAVMLQHLLPGNLLSSIPIEPAHRGLREACDSGGEGH